VTHAVTACLFASGFALGRLPRSHGGAAYLGDVAVLCIVFIAGKAGFRSFKNGARFPGRRFPFSDNCRRSDTQHSYVGLGEVHWRSKHMQSPNAGLVTDSVTPTRLLSQCSVHKRTSRFSHSSILCYITVHSNLLVSSSHSVATRHVSLAPDRTLEKSSSFALLCGRQSI
jgi:hypothetical protein